MGDLETYFSYRNSGINLVGLAVGTEDELRALGASAADAGVQVCGAGFVGAVQLLSDCVCGGVGVGGFWAGAGWYEFAGDFGDLLEWVGGGFDAAA